jgi:hypothetical protein
MKRLTILTIFLIIYNYSHAQGCVAIRSNGGTCTMLPYQPSDQKEKTSDWSIGINNRYFRSFRHFVGTAEQKQRVEQGTQVINKVFATEVRATHDFNNRWSFSLYTPIIANMRSSLYEHDGKDRRSTHSFGVGDIRLAGYYWLMDPAKHMKGNIQLGLGIKFPTGDYKYQDYFYKNDSVKVLGPVDQSIQLGDGGTGISLEVNSYYFTSANSSLYLNAFYLSNPREQNGVSTARGALPSASAIVYGSDVMSVPDQYMFRAGGSYGLRNLTLSAGMRMECVPVHDLIGGSNGFRRPGYVLSVEPVAEYKTSVGSFYISVPYAVQRNRTQSVPDKIKTQFTGIYSQGDAAFADYSINFGASFRIKK